MNKSKLYLVGAGPGDEELITLKGVKALKEANVVLYDALANKRLLNHCPPETKLIYVGKRAGEHYEQQQSINELIVAHAKVNAVVVRLKGGDPFVFGRGYEEKEYAEAHGIQVEVISGISSALAVPIGQNIPITKRGANESFWVITGTTKDDELSKDMELAAQSSATVVVLMGIKKLPLIIQLFKTYRGENEPIAVIMNGTCENESAGIGTLSTIESVVKEKKLASPSVIVIGEVVRYGTNALEAIAYDSKEI
ncbi:MAG: uroporphyrin-III C-methyltransferase [Cyclobacteriaceae bacterium]